MSFLTSKYQLQNIAVYFDTPEQFRTLRLVSTTFNMGVFEALSVQKVELDQKKAELEKQTEQSGEKQKEAASKDEKKIELYKNILRYADAVTDFGDAKEIWQKMLTKVQAWNKSLNKIDPETCPNDYNKRKLFTKKHAAY